MTRKPEIKSIKDFTDKDRIALPSIKSSAQVIFLWEASEKEWGTGNWNKLDSISVSMAHPDALASIMNNSGDITAHAATSPYAEIEKKAGAHSVTDAYAAAGSPVTGLNFCSTEAFRKDNPKTYEAVVAAFNEAIDWINADKARAAKFYLDFSHDKISLEDLVTIFQQPDYIFGPAPRGVGKALDLMYRTGAIKTKATSWKDMYFPEAGNLKGD
ncbi:MAG: ABC transporter substrate-binding protein [Proteobacteria bacterium]|nr:ABC transporter substrate-binding protein [Pseudomonadota bacterium]